MNAPNANTTQTSRLRSLAAAIVTSVLFVAGCGGGGGSTAVNGVAPTPAAQANSYTTVSDDYGMAAPSYLAATSSAMGVVLRTALATGLSDPNFKTISRIDIPAGFSPAGTYSLGAAVPGVPAFPGALYFFDGHLSTLLHTVGGTITFTSFGSNTGDRVTGSFNALVADGGDSEAGYSIAASFDFATGTSGAVVPAPAAPNQAAARYDALCASCHALGAYDTTLSGASDLALKGGKMNALFTADQATHQGLLLTAAEISALKVLLNTN